MNVARCYNQFTSLLGSRDNLLDVFHNFLFGIEVMGIYQMLVHFWWLYFDIIIETDNVGKFLVAFTSSGTENFTFITAGTD